MSVTVKKAFYFFPTFTLVYLPFHYSVIESCKINQRRSPDCLTSVPRSDSWKAVLCECFHVSSWSKHSEKWPLANLVKGRLNSKYVLEDSYIPSETFRDFSPVIFAYIPEKNLFLSRGEDGTVCQSISGCHTFVSLWYSPVCAKSSFPPK